MSKTYCFELLVKVLHLYGHPDGEKLGKTQIPKKQIFVRRPIDHHKALKLQIRAIKEPSAAHVNETEIEGGG